MLNAALTGSGTPECDKDVTVPLCEQVSKCIVSAEVGDRADLCGVEPGAADRLARGRGAPRVDTRARVATVPDDDDPEVI